MGTYIFTATLNGQDTKCGVALSGVTHEVWPGGWNPDILDTAGETRWTENADGSGGEYYGGFTSAQGCDPDHHLTSDVSGNWTVDFWVDWSPNPPNPLYPYPDYNSGGPIQYAGDTYYRFRVYSVYGALNQTDFVDKNQADGDGAFGHTQTLNIEWGGKAQGTVTDCNTSVGISGASVELQDASHNVVGSYTTDSNGDWGPSAALDRGWYHIHVSATEYVSKVSSPVYCLWDGAADNIDLCLDFAGHRNIHILRGGDYELYRTWVA